MSKVIHALTVPLIGAAIGFTWNWFFSCPTGRCPLSHNPQLAAVIATLFGAGMGYVVSKM